MTDFALNFAMVQDFFAWRYEIPDSRRTALRGKLQNLQKFGIPAGVNTGRGKPAKYGPRQMIELSIAMDLMDLGFPPDSVVTILRSEFELVLESLNVDGSEMPSYYGVDGPRPSLMIISAFAKSNFVPRRRSIQIMTPKEFADGIEKDDLTIAFPIAVIDLQLLIFRLKDWFVIRHPDGKRLRELVEQRGPTILRSMSENPK